MGCSALFPSLGDSTKGLRELFLGSGIVKGIMGDCSC